MCSTIVSRRTTLKTLGTLGFGLGSLVGSVAADTQEAEGTGTAATQRSRETPPATCDVAEQRGTSASADALSDRPGRYIAVVDRIVDGQHAVLLLEDGDETVGQLVVPYETLAPVEEGDVLLTVVEDDESEPPTEVTDATASVELLEPRLD